MIELRDADDYRERLELLYIVFTDPPDPEIDTLSLHDALPICQMLRKTEVQEAGETALLRGEQLDRSRALDINDRSEEHTSELQSRLHLVCRLLLEKKKQCIHSLPGAGARGKS